MVAAVHTPTARRRLPAASARAPSTGARSASTSPVIDQTQSLVYLFYKNTFVINEQGEGAAVVLTLFIIIVLITLIQFRLQRRWVHYE